MTQTIHATACDSFHEQGFYLAKSLLSREEAGRILDHGMTLVKTAETPNRLMNPHREDEPFMRWFRHPAIIDMIEAIVAERALGVQTMFYIKPPLTTGHGWHQDQYYIPGEPKPILAAWCALDEIDEENGALVVYPGSHLLGLLPMAAHSDKRFKNHETAIAPPGDIEPMTVSMAPGDVLFFDGFMIHGSGPNHSDKRYRRAFVSHYVAEGSMGAAEAKGFAGTKLQ